MSVPLYMKFISHKCGQKLQTKYKLTNTQNKTNVNVVRGNKTNGRNRVRWYNNSVYTVHDRSFRGWALHGLAAVRAPQPCIWWLKKLSHYQESYATHITNFQVKYS